MQTYKRKYIESNEGSFLDNKKIPKENQVVYFLSGSIAPFKILKGIIKSITNIDQKGLSNTYFDIESNNKLFHVNIGSVFDHKPKQIEIEDEFGKIKIWQ